MCEAIDRSDLIIAVLVLMVPIVSGLFVLLSLGDKLDELNRWLSDIAREDGKDWE